MELEDPYCPRQNRYLMLPSSHECRGLHRMITFMRGDESYKQRFASGFRLLSVFTSGRSLAGKISVLMHAWRKEK